jgi:hypothetical protein
MIGAVHEHVLRRHAGARRRAAIPGERALARSGDRGDGPGRANASHARVAEVGDEEVARRVGGEGAGIVEAGLGGRAAIPGEAGLAGPRDGEDRSGRGRRRGGGQWRVRSRDGEYDQRQADRKADRALVGAPPRDEQPDASPTCAAIHESLLL